MELTVVGWVQVAASSSMGTSLGNTWWEYIVLFLAVAASWAGVPAIGSAAVGAAAVAASQGKLNLAAVIIISAIAGEAGGLIGYRIGWRWGNQILARPGKRQSGRQKMMDRGEAAYAKWGRMAVFVTPAIISGTARMDHGQFALWNFVASLAFTLSVAATAYGAGRVATGHHNPVDIVVLIFGVVLGAALIFVMVRRRRRRSPSALSPADR
jgi:membrane-associated protein